MKVCTDCKQPKQFSEFNRDRSKKHGYKARCKPCCAKRQTEFRRRGDYDKRRYWKNPEAERERHLVRKYGVSLADYEAMLVQQDGKCAICRRAQSKAFDVDHCHESGHVRGLLCTNCNRMVGHAADSPERLRAAADYLESSRKSRRNS